MSNYTKSTNFATKDNLTPGDPLKVVRGTEIDTEFNNISTAIATKTDNSAAAITGGAIDGATVGATTPATGAFTTLAASGTTTLAGALVGAATQSAFNTVSTTLNLGGAATALNLGAATGTATVNNTTLAAKAITASTTLAVTGTSTLTGAVTATAGVSGPITSSSVSITGGSITGITDLAVADGGTGASTAAGGLNNLLPSQTGNASKYLQTDGTNASWDAVSLSTADITGTLGAANGGTGVSNNAAMTVTGSGNFAYTRTLTGTTNVTFPTTGTLATLAGTETLTNKTLTSPTLTTPTLGVATGTSFQGIIGNVTPAAGSFTTLGASSTATLNTLSSSGATLTGGTINGMTVGATTPSSGAFTTVTASTAIGTASGGTGLGGATPFTSGGVVYASSSSVLATGSALTFDGTNLGAGGATTPSAPVDIQSNSGGTGIRIRGRVSANAGALRFFTNDNTTQRARFESNDTSFEINSIANLPITFLTNDTEGLRLTPTSLYTASGINVGIGTSSPSVKLEVVGPSGDNLIGTFRSGDATAANNAGGGFRSTSSATAASRLAQIWLDADGANLSGGDYFTIEKRGNSGTADILQYSNAAMRFGTNYTARAAYDMTLNSAGNLGLGVTPSAWETASGRKAIQVGTTIGHFAGGGYITAFSNNAYYNGTNSIYINDGAAHQYLQLSTGHIWNTAASGTAGNAISFTQAMTLNTDGGLMVGTTSTVGGRLTLNATTSGESRMVLKLNDTQYCYFGGYSGITGSGNADDVGLFAWTGKQLMFGTNATERARIDSSGNLLVGTTSNLGGLGGKVQIDSAGSRGLVQSVNANVRLQEYLVSGSTVGFISTDGTNTTYSTSSDYRLKNTIAPMTGALAKVALLKPCTYKWNADGSNGEGFIAHELAEVVPECVSGAKDAVDADGNPVYQGIDTSFLVATVVAALQELKAEFDAYKASHP